MKGASSHYFWDACVFIRYLKGDRSAELFSDISQHLEDAKAGKTAIYYSTMSIVEVRPSFLGGAGYGDFDAFLADFEGAFFGVDPTPDIMRWSAIVHDISYPCPTGGKDGVLTTPDAIQFMSAVYLREVGGVPDIIFHTFDNGKGTTAESEGKKTVSLLEFEKWVAGIPKNSQTKRICDLPRSKPVHPLPDMFSV